MRYKDKFSLFPGMTIGTTPMPLRNFFKRDSGKGISVMRIARSILLGFALTFLPAACQNSKTEQTFALKDLVPVIIKTGGNEIHQYWEFKNEPFLWKADPGSAKDLKAYRDSLAMELGDDNFRYAVEKEAAQKNHLSVLDSADGDLFNAQLVHSGRAGAIRPVNFLEVQLLNYQLSRYPLLSHPTEFQALVLRNDSLNKVRVYFTASDQPWPPKPEAILDSVAKALEQGWSFTYDLHNHYEPKSDNYVGILAPSLADAQFFNFLSEKFNLDKALITNGFNTVEINRTEFSKFKFPE